MWRELPESFLDLTDAPSELPERFGDPHPTSRDRAEPPAIAREESGQVIRFSGRAKLTSLEVKKYSY